MLRYMQQATEAALGVGSGEFLDRFKAWGWFLDDLVLTPVNNLKNQRSALQNAERHKALEVMWRSETTVPTPCTPPFPEILSNANPRLGG